MGTAVGVDFRSPVPKCGIGTRFRDGGGDALILAAVGRAGPSVPENPRRHSANPSFIILPSFLLARSSTFSPSLLRPRFPPDHHSPFLPRST
ncbi:hypothetical protein PGTUg99_022897 [Puccinia graminis f. sp. tritici]|uniref:Uncharacterized protein n=1 Tax=Puccinia graminis f. sp. tritici TaxID=56615 RepID=A0A5B0RLU1_PUCGR|nr:hypothetical protein PGTUg99_022897 [Puccinia graminis f. sp. tritici]